MRPLLLALATWAMLDGTAIAGKVTVAWDAETDADATGYVVSYGPSPGVYTNSVDVGMRTTCTITGLAAGQRYYFAVRAYDARGQYSDPSNEVTPLAPPSDFDGDARADLVVWRPATGTWHVAESTTEYWQSLTVPWGAGWLDDRPVPGDYDGDFRTDYAVWRPETGTWFFMLSTLQYGTHQVDWGLGRVGDRPVPADYDGDGKVDPAVWRGPTGIWYVLLSSASYAQALRVEWGKDWAGDVPVPADYDGDGRADLAVWRAGTGTWHVLLSSRQYLDPSLDIRWGLGAATDVPVPGDYDGDGKADPAVWRRSDGIWRVLPSGSGYVPGRDLEVAWGLGSAGDHPVADDYDGDGRTDFAVWREPTGTWYVLRSGSGGGRLTKPWGTRGDIPVYRR